MIRIAAVCGLMTILAMLTALAGGCASARSEDLPYKSLKDVDYARRMADLVVEGTVAETLAAERRPVEPFIRESVLAGNPAAEPDSNMNCLLKTRVTLDVAQVVKSASYSLAISPTLLILSMMSWATKPWRPSWPST